jgi:hypothetical protein
MCKGAAQLLPPVETSADDFALANNDSTYRHFTVGGGLLCLIQRYTHISGVFKIVIGRMFHRDESTIAQNKSQKNSVPHTIHGNETVGSEWAAKNDKFGQLWMHVFNGRWFDVGRNMGDPRHTLSNARDLRLKVWIGKDP